MFSDLFWALYFIDILSNSFSTALVGIVVASILCFLFWWLSHQDIETVRDYNADIAKEKIAVIEKSNKAGLAKAKNIFWITIFITVVAIFIPSKTTMYMMLGVRTTENFSKTEMGKKLEAFLNKEIDKMIGTK